MGGSQGHSPAQIDIDDVVFGAMQPVIQGTVSEKESDKDDSEFESDLAVLSQSALT